MEEEPKAEANAEATTMLYAKQQNIEDGVGLSAQKVAKFVGDSYGVTLSARTILRYIKDGKAGRTPKRGETWSQTRLFA